MDRLTVTSERTKWVFTYVPAGEVVKVLDDDVGSKPFRYDYDVVQGHVIDTRIQFMPQTPPNRFLKETVNLTPSAIHRYFRVTKDSLTQETLAVVRNWVRQQQRDAPTR